MAEGLLGWEMCVKVSGRNTARTRLVDVEKSETFTESMPWV